MSYNISRDTFDVFYENQNFHGDFSIFLLRVEEITVTKWTVDVSLAVILREKCLRWLAPAPHASFFVLLCLSLFSLSLSLYFICAYINSAVQNYRVLRRTVPRKWSPRKGRRFLLVIKIYARTTWTLGWRRAFFNEAYTMRTAMQMKNAEKYRVIHESYLSLYYPN